MGTSQSSKGSPSGVPMIPPWVPDIANPQSTASQPTPVESDPANRPISQSLINAPAVSIAPRGRFGGANRSIGDYASSGDRRVMQRALGQYVRKGYGGHSTATKRMGNTIATAGALYTALTPGTTNPHTQTGQSLDPALLAGKSSDEVMDALVETACPVNGTQDAEASRNSVKEALSEVLTQFPEADLMDLTPEQREVVIKTFIAEDIFRRVELDIGHTVLEKAPSAAEGLSRLKEIKSYVKETVNESFRKAQRVGQILGSDRINNIITSVLNDAFEVFEGYAE